MDWTQVVSALVGALTGVVGAYVVLRKDRREEHQARDDEADRTIELLEKQIDILEKQLEETKRQGEAREAEWQERRAEWQRREAKLEGRIENLEQWRIDEINARSRLQMCKRAPECKDYDPGMKEVDGS